MSPSAQFLVSTLLRRVPLRHRPVARALIYGAHCQLSNALWSLRNPRMRWRVYRLMRLMERGRTEIEA